MISHFVSADSNEMTLGKKHSLFLHQADLERGVRWKEPPRAQAVIFPTLNTPPTVSLERLFRQSSGRRFLLIYLFDDYNRYCH